MARTCLTIILAAGEGTRMKSSQSKVLHEVAGLSMLGHVMKAAKAAGGDAQAVVVGRQAEMVEAETRRFVPDVTICEQKERLGTGNAVLAASEVLNQGFDDVLILFGDAPLIRPETLARLRETLEQGAHLVVLGCRTQEPDGYGRLIEKDGELVAIREQKDASEEELAITFCNSGVMAFSGAHVLDLLNSIENNNVKKEYYLTDCVEIARERGLKVVAIEADEKELHGVNDRYELARIEGIWQTKRREELMRSGVNMQAPETVFLSHDSEIEADTILEPNIVFGSGVKISSGAHIRAFSHLEGAQIEAGAVVGPFARLRPGTKLDTGSKVGNFCEIKNATIEAGAKVNHLSYIGDALVGANANVGAGVITCNYDGLNKHFTEIGKDAFIGTDSSLVAPVKIGEGAYIASGSVITKDVADNALAIARGYQEEKPGYANKIRERNAAFKAKKKPS